MSDDSMMTAEEIRVRNLKRRRILIGLILLLLLLVAGFFGGRPALNAIKAWQARRHAAKAFEYIDQQNWLEARKEATAAYQLRPTEPQALRAVARFLSRTRQPDALEFWQRLEEIAPLTREDRQDEAAIAIMTGETARAELAVNALLESEGADSADWLLSAQLSIQKGAPDDAISALRKIFADSRATEQQQLQAALLELSLTGSDSVDDRVKDAWSRIEELSQGQSAVALDALVLRARRQLSSPSSTSQPLNNSTAADLAQRIEAHPLAKAPQKLLALDLLEHVNPSRHNELVANGIAEWKNSDAQDLLALATWLNGKREFKKMLDAIPLEKALLNRELFLQYLDALGGLERWREVEQILESDRYPLDPVIQKMYLARCNTQLDEKTAAENNWQRALEAAGGDTGKLITLAEYAEKNGVVDVARQAFDAAATEAPSLRVAQQGRLRIAQRSGDTKDLHTVLAELLKIWPNDAAVQNDEAYTRLLLLGSNQPQVKSKNEKVENPASVDSKAVTASSDLQAPNSRLAELDQIVRLAANLVVKNPRSMPHRTLLALAYLKENRVADAVVVYKDITVPPSALTPSALAVHAAVLAANGNSSDAKKEASELNQQNLLPEERALIANLR